MKNKYLITGIAAMLLTLSACAKNNGDTQVKDAVATINGKQLSAEAFDIYATAVARKPAKELTAEQKNQILDQYINMQLAAEVAEKNSLDKTAEVKSQLSLARMNVLTEAAVKKYIEEHPVTDAEIKAEYDTQIAAIGHEYKARHILVESKAVAESIIQQLQAGEDFAKLAAKESKDASAKQGGDLGWFTLQSMVPAFGQAVASLEKGKFTTTPVQTQYGFHVIKLEDIRTATPPAFDTVKDQVKGIVQRKKLQAYLEDLRKSAKIEKTLPKDAPAPATEVPKEQK